MAALPDFNEHIEHTRKWLESPAVQGFDFLSLRHAAESWIGRNIPQAYDSAHASEPEIWDANYWAQNPELQKFVALNGTA